jgi:hypothetical protein
LEFQERFSTEEACREYLFASRWPEGFVCPGCGGTRAGAETRRHLWICTACGLQTSVTAGTVMHGTRMPLRTWFWAAYLVSTFHPGISAKQLQRQLGLGCHETAWAMLHKLRGAMVAPERQPLKGEVEVDEFFLGGDEEGKRGGRQRGKKALVGVAVEVCGRGSARLRLGVLKDASANSLNAFVQATTTPGAIVHTDAWHGYDRLEKAGYRHQRHNQSAAPGEQLLPRAHPPSRTSRPGCTAPTAASHPSTCPSTSTSTSSATTAAARRWPASRRCSGSAPTTYRSPTATSSTAPPDHHLERTRYALAGYPARFKEMSGVQLLYRRGRWREALCAQRMLRRRHRGPARRRSSATRPIIAVARPPALSHPPARDANDREFVLVQLGAGEHEPKLTPTERAVDHLKRVDLHLRFADLDRRRGGGRTRWPIRGIQFAAECANHLSPRAGEVQPFWPMTRRPSPS